MWLASHLSGIHQNVPILFSEHSFEETEITRGNGQFLEQRIGFFTTGVANPLGPSSPISISISRAWCEGSVHTAQKSA